MTQHHLDRQAQQPTLSQDIVLECLDPWGRSVDVPTTLNYRPGDPYAVSLTFHSPSGDVEWFLARTLLLQGLAAPAGDGDVKASPAVDEHGRAVVLLEFSSPDGQLAGQVGSRQLQAFLTRTFKSVPVGTESDHLDLDALVDGLLSERA